MSGILDEYVKLEDKYYHLKLDKDELGRRNQELNMILGELKSDNARLTALVSEKYEISPDLARANSKLYQQGLRIRAMKAAIKDLKEKLAHKLTDGEVIELIKAYANKKEEAEILRRIIERMKDGTNQCRRD